MNYLPVGHTHEDVDQIFSRLVAWLKSHVMRTIAETDSALRQFMSQTFERAAPHVAEVVDVADVWSWMKDCVRQDIHNITEARSFRIAMHSDGWARLWYRLAMSTNEAWQPEQGFQLITGIPSGRPCLVSCWVGFDFMNYVFTVAYVCMMDA